MIAEPTNDDLPTWFAEPTLGCLDFLNHLMDLMELTEVAITRAHNEGDLGRTLATRWNDLMGERGDPEGHRRRGLDVEALAKSEVEGGFQTFRAQNIVLLWGTLERFANDLLVAVLVNDPGQRADEALKAVKGSLIDLVGLDIEEQCAQVAHAAGWKAKGTGSGANRLESILKLAGLSGPVDPIAKQNLHVLNEMRNVIVHRRGVADRRFLERCPLPGMKMGERMRIDLRTVRAFSMSALNYSTCVINRGIKKYSGGDHQVRMAKLDGLELLGGAS